MSDKSLYGIIQHHCLVNNENPFEPGVESLEEAGMGIKDLLGSFFDSPNGKKCKKIVVSHVEEVKVMINGEEKVCGHTRALKLGWYTMMVSLCSILKHYQHENVENITKKWLRTTYTTRIEILKRIKDNDENLERILDEEIKQQENLKSRVDRPFSEYQNRHGDDKEIMHFKAAIHRWVETNHAKKKQLSSLETCNVEQLKSVIWSIVRVHAVTDEIDRIEDFLRKHTQHASKHEMLQRLNLFLVTHAHQKQYIMEGWLSLVKCKVTTENSSGGKKDTDILSEILPKIWTDSGITSFGTLLSAEAFKNMYLRIIEVHDPKKQ